MLEKKETLHLERLLKRFPELEPISQDIARAYSILERAFFNEGSLFVCGNGGSASDGEHIVGELMKGFKLKRPLNKDLVAKFEKEHGDSGKELSSKLQMGLRAVSLTSHPALMTAYMNDVDPEMIFAQQLFVLGRKGDVFMGISCSGNAKNAMHAFKVAKVKGIDTILLTGMNGGICEKYAECIIRAPSKETFIIQEYHLPIYHTLCLMIEEKFYGSGG